MSVIACTYFDGKRSLGRPASVIISRSAIQIVGHDVVQSFETRAVRLSEPICTTPRWIYFPDGSTCWVPESSSLTRFVRDARLDRLVHQWESRPALAALALALVVALVWALIQFGVPAGARIVAQRIPASAETRLGVETLAGLDKQWMTPTKLPPNRRAALRAKFDKMARAGVADKSASGKQNNGAAVLEFRASKMIGPNAFALPGNIMVITDELVALTTHDNEILGVLAHELGHVRERHAMRGLLESSAVALLIAGITGDIASTTSLAASAPVLLLQNKFSRDNEIAADQYAIALMQKAGIDPKHFAIMLGRLEEKSEGGAIIPAFLSSHPATEARKALALEASRAKPVEAE